MTDSQADGCSIVTLRFAARPEHVVLARLVLTGIAVAEGLDSTVVSDLKLAVSEACASAVERTEGSGAAGAADVTVRYRVEPGLVAVEVSGPGAGLDPEAVRAARTLVDELEITAGPGGSRVAFAKRTAPAAGRRGG